MNEFAGNTALEVIVLILVMPPGLVIGYATWAHILGTMWRNRAQLPELAARKARLSEDPRYQMFLEDKPTETDA